MIPGPDSSLLGARNLARSRCFVNIVEGTKEQMVSFRKAAPGGREDNYSSLQSTCCISGKMPDALGRVFSFYTCAVIWHLHARFTGEETGSERARCSVKDTQHVKAVHSWHAGLSNLKATQLLLGRGPLSLDQ